MREAIQKIGKFYSKVMMQNISLFFVYGICGILFSASGWIPNEEVSGLADLVYYELLPVLIGYTAGNRIQKEIGGPVGALAALGIVAADGGAAITGAMIFSPLAAWITSAIYQRTEKKIPAGFGMLFRNLLIGLLGCFFLVVAYGFAAPVLMNVSNALCHFVDKMIQYHLIPFVSLLIEPAKVFFLNNGINHGILAPLGLGQVQTEGASILFLLETNPGPGLGVLLAWLFREKKERKHCLSCMAVEFVGGIHEIYFPFVTMRPVLFFAVAAGGMAGTAFFSIFHVGLVGPASPGSILTIFMMCRQEDWFGLICGILISAAVSAGAAVFLIKRAPYYEKEDRRIESTKVKEIRKKEIKNICFICDAGLGSSAMGAALLRKKMKASGILGIDISHTSTDEMPKEADLIICQDNYKEVLMRQQCEIEIYTVDSLLNTKDYEPLLERLKKKEV